VSKLVTPSQKWENWCSECRAEVDDAVTIVSRQTDNIILCRPCARVVAAEIRALAGDVA
jgi:hypothetical protein